MTPQQRQHFEALLTQRAEALDALRQAAAKGLETVQLDQTRVGRLSRMDAMQAQAMNQAAQRLRDAELIAIKAALARLDNDDYGYCDACGEDINPGRLEVDPTALLCVSCAEQCE